MCKDFAQEREHRARAQKHEPQRYPCPPPLCDLLGPNVCKTNAGLSPTLHGPRCSLPTLVQSEPSGTILICHHPTERCKDDVKTEGEDGKPQRQVQAPIEEQLHHRDEPSQLKVLLD